MAKYWPLRQKPSNNQPIRPILEYGYQVYQVASDTNLKKLERLQLSAACIVTELLGSTPADIVLYEADLQPLCLRSTPNLTKYVSKLLSYNNQQRTANFLRSWQNNQRLKKSSPLKKSHPSAHSWYRSEGPGATIHYKGDRKDQTALANLNSSHLKTLRFSHGDKKFNICTKCNTIEVTPHHLLDCVALVYDDLLKAVFAKK
ncbi:hypothetical protein AVEN_100134-1 [Araneus ventricosus]|uniref:Uncharacterized protein n=1 Tax=Araneus ventricosus TaxID=182803 RepID=A0A4Y2BF24_ARAVE|nr:hypothetical protein AVEN_100134-1 [Araneus ventricosus]